MAEAASAAVLEPLLQGLPDVISIWEILVRLPPKALLRCRAVCPAWRRVTSTRDFLLAHHGRQPTFPLIKSYEYGLDEYGLDKTIASIIIPFDHRAGWQLSGHPPTSLRAGLANADQLLLQSVARFGLDCFRMVACCDGLLVLHINHMQFCICNPATRQYAPLPIPMAHEFWLMGMYPHSPTGEYRLLLNNGRGPPTAEYAHVFTIGSCQPPRRIGCPGNIIFTSRVSLLLHGCLHWHEYKSQMIAVFDTTAESFRQMRSPVVSDDACLFEIGGMLGIYSFNNGATTVSIWVLQDYEGCVWAFKHRVELPVAQLSKRFGQFDNQLCVVVPSGDGDVFVLARLGHWLLHIDSDGKLVASFRRRGLYACEVQLKQTLVQHAFFPSLEGYVVNASPFMQLLSEVRCKEKSYNPS